MTLRKSGISTKQVNTYPPLISRVGLKIVSPYSLWERGGHEKLRSASYPIKALLELYTGETLAEEGHVGGLPPWDTLSGVEAANLLYAFRDTLVTAKSTNLLYVEIKLVAKKDASGAYLGPEEVVTIERVD